MLGTDVGAGLAGREVSLLARAELDITDYDAVKDRLAGVDVVINASAYTRVDDAEGDEDAATAVNAAGPANLAKAAAANGAVLVQVSTDYVFDGTGTTPYAESTPLSPRSAYGRTKAEGERLALAANPESTIILRTAWLYGRHGSNFASTMLRLAEERDTVAVVADQIGQPTWSADVASQLVALLDSGVRSGIFHATNSGHASWFDFARALFTGAGLDPNRVTPTTSADYPRPAPRPAYSVLGHEAWATVGLEPMRPWEDALASALASGAIGSRP